MSYIKAPSQSIASPDTLGMVIVGEGLRISNDGRLSVYVQPENRGAVFERPSVSGRWTPKLISGPGGSAVATEDCGSSFVKFGPLLFACFDLKITEVKEHKKQSYVMLEGLPYLTTSGGEYCGSVTISYFSGLSPHIASLSGSVREGSFSCDLWCQLTSHTDMMRLQRSQLADGGRLQGSVLCIAS